MGHSIHKHMHTHITKQNVKAAIRDDKAHMDYLKRDVKDDQRAGGKYKDINQTADEKHISKLAGDVRYDKKKEGMSRYSSSDSPAEVTAAAQKKIMASDANPAFKKAIAAASPVDNVTYGDKSGKTGYIGEAKYDMKYNAVDDITQGKGKADYGMSRKYKCK